MGAGMSGSIEGQAVGRIVAADWRAAAIFEQFGIDFCCGGRQSVADACRSAGIDTAEVVRALEDLPSDEAEDDVLHWPIDRLIDHIVLTHHAYVRSALPRIAGYLRKVRDVHGERHPELAQIATEFGTLGGDLLEHLLKEEYVLFPYVRELAGEGSPLPSPFGTVENPIRVMEREHEDAGVHLGRIRRLTAAYTVPADACTTYRVCFEELAHFERDLQRHIHLEENVLFPKAVELEGART